MARSSCDTRYQDGMVFHVARSTEAPKTLPMIGFWVAAAIRASLTGRSAAKTSRNFAVSTQRQPAASGLSAAPSGAGYFSPNAPIGSPESGANAAMKTSALTLGLPAAAAVITAPPYECPTSTTGPGCAATTRFVVSTSVASDVSGFCTAITL